MNDAYKKMNDAYEKVFMRISDNFLYLHGMIEELAKRVLTLQEFDEFAKAVNKKLEEKPAWVLLKKSPGHWKRRTTSHSEPKA